MSDVITLILRRAAPQSIIPLVLFVGLLLLVQSRSMAILDRGVLGFIAATRPTGLTDVMNWLFRLGFAQVDFAVAVTWSAVILIVRRSVGAAIRPLLITVVIAIEVGLRLVVNQPQPGPEFDLTRKSPVNSVASVLDRGDESVRSGFAQAAQPITPPGRGSFPSGHASRTAFLALCAIGSLTRAREEYSAVKPQAIAPATRHCAWIPSGLVFLGCVVCAIFPVFVRYSAMFFGYHWPSDILAGFLLAFAILPIARRSQRVLISGVPGA